VIDLHCHVLPGIDDGPATLEEALALARALVAAGVETVAATPHVSPDHPNTAERIATARAQLVEALAEHGVPLRVVGGAEVDLLHVQALPAEELAGLRLGDSRALLVEAPFASVVPQFEALIMRLQSAGHRVVLAHPERSSLFLHEPALLERLVGRGALASVTAAALTGRFGGTPRRFALRAIEHGLVHDVSTDAHDVAGRGPVLRDAVLEAGLAWTADWLLRDAPAAILADAPLPPRPGAPRPSGWRRVKALVQGARAR
jgi:protein-tyrosine phosphatase